MIKSSWRHTFAFRACARGENVILNQLNFFLSKIIISVADTCLYFSEVFEILMLDYFKQQSPYNYYEKQKKTTTTKQNKTKQKTVHISRISENDRMWEEYVGMGMWWEGGGGGGITPVSIQ